MLGKTPVSGLIPPAYLAAGDGEAVEVFAGGMRLAVELMKGVLQKGHHGARSSELASSETNPRLPGPLLWTRCFSSACSPGLSQRQCP